MPRVESHSETRTGSKEYAPVHVGRGLMETGYLALTSHPGSSGPVSILSNDYACDIKCSVEGVSAEQHGIDVAKCVRIRRKEAETDGEYAMAGTAGGGLVPDRPGRSGTRQTGR